MFEEKDVQIFSADVDWYDDYAEQEKHDIVIGFAENAANFIARIEHEFTYIDAINLKVVNTWATPSELLYISSDSIRKVLEDENSY